MVYGFPPDADATDYTALSQDEYGGEIASLDNGDMTSETALARLQNDMDEGCGHGAERRQIEQAAQLTAKASSTPVNLFFRVIYGIA